MNLHLLLSKLNVFDSTRRLRSEVHVRAGEGPRARAAGGRPFVFCLGSTARTPLSYLHNFSHLYVRPVISDPDHQRWLDEIDKIEADAARLGTIDPEADAGGLTKACTDTRVKMNDYRGHKHHKEEMSRLRAVNTRPRLSARSPR